MFKIIKVGACQGPDIQDDIPAALKHIKHTADAAQDAAVICFPEYFVQGYVAEKVEAHRRSIDLGSVSFATILRQLKEYSPTLVIGLIEKVNDRLHNTAIVVSHGELKGVYRKTHLLERESGFSPGTEYPVFDLNSIKFGVNICYDARFEVGAQTLANKGAQIICFPLNNTLPKKTAERWKNRHIEVLSARAKQAGAWVLSADVVFNGGGKTGYGCTAMIDPAGATIKQQEYGEVGLITAMIPLPLGSP